MWFCWFCIVHIQDKAILDIENELRKVTDEKTELQQQNRINIQEYQVQIQMYQEQLRNSEEELEREKASSRPMRVVLLSIILQCIVFGYFVTL